MKKLNLDKKNYKFLNPSNLIRNIIYEGQVSQDGIELLSSGQVRVLTGKHTGRSAEDKFMVDNPRLKGKIDFGSSAGKLMPLKEFTLLQDDMLGLYHALDFFDGFAGGKKIRIVSSRNWHLLFAFNLFQKSKIPHKKPDLVIVDLPDYLPCYSYYSNKTRKVVIACDFAGGLILIHGTCYAGEIKKAVFSYLSYCSVLENKLPMHSSATTDQNGENTALFFGLSGTGKTTLSSDINRKLVGDDEHIWSDEGVFNIEAGCYAKTIDLDPEKEPLIFDACNSFATVLENVDIDYETREPIFSSRKYTENTRAAYSLDKIKNSHPVGFMAPHPKNIIFLSCDAFGILPPVAKLDYQQAIYHYGLGYTCKISGTEKGITEPKPVFSKCFGAPFMPHALSHYEKIFKEKLEKYQPNVWLVNTGWYGQSYSQGGKRIELSQTRQIIDNILNNKFNGLFQEQIKFLEFDNQKIEFKLQVPVYKNF